MQTPRLISFPRGKTGLMDSHVALLFDRLVNQSMGREPPVCGKPPNAILHFRIELEANGEPSGIFLLKGITGCY
jgi:hypothetical protein